MRDRERENGEKGDPTVRFGKIHECGRGNILGKEKERGRPTERDQILRFGKILQKGRARGKGISTCKMRKRENSEKRRDPTLGLENIHESGRGWTKRIGTQYRSLKNSRAGKKGR